MKFIVSTDAGADLDLEYVGANNVKILSMRYYLDDGNGEKEYVFGNGEPGLTYAEFYDKVRKGKQAKTALINQEQHRDHFEKLLKEEGKPILHIPLSSGLSGTAECAAKAAAELNESGKGAKIIVVDFMGASMGQGLYVDYLVRMRDEGKTVEEAAAWAEANKLKLCHFFTVDDLGHLRRGGRVSGAAAFIGSLLKIKPLLHVDNAGKLIPIGKNLGRKKALVSLVEKMHEHMDTPDQRVFISHADSLDDAQFVAEELTSRLGVKDITIGYIGPIIGAHSGPGTIALFFMGKNR
jgi:DegV family protein with EDD domain